MRNNYSRKIDIKANAEAGLFDAAISSETPVLQQDPVTKVIFQEILSHDPGAMSVFRNRGAVKLRWNHDPNTLIGVAENIRIDAVNKIGRAAVRFGNTPQAQGLKKDTEEEIATDLSVGYSYSSNNVEVDRTTNPETRRVRKWQLNELSVVPDGADETVGFGRAMTALDETLNSEDAVNTQTMEEAETGLPGADPDKDPKDELKEGDEEVRTLKARVAELEAQLRCNGQERSADSTEEEEDPKKEDLDGDSDDERSAKNIKAEGETEATRADISTIVEESATRSLTTTSYEETMTDNLQVTQPVPTTNMRSADLKDYSISKMIRGLMTGGQTGLEREVAQEVGESTVPTQVFERAFALNGAATAGAEFKVPQFGGYLDLLLPQTLFGKLGCPSMNLAQPVTLPGGDVPSPTQSTETGFIATPAAETDPTSRNVLFSPKVAISQIALTRVMLESGTPGVDAYLVNLLRKRHASSFEDAAWAQILAEISQTYDYTGGATNHDTAVDYAAGLLGLVQVVSNQIDEPAGSAFVTNHILFNKLTQVKKAANLTVPVAAAGMIWDRPAVASSRVKAISTYEPIVYGAWENCQLASFGSGVNIVVDQITKALSDQVLITGQAHWDAHVVQPVAFAKCVNAN